MTTLHLSITTTIIFLLLFTTTFGRHQCVKVVGRLRCPTDWDRHYKVVVKLMDKDRK